jgi:hypothetical protein
MSTDSRVSLRDDVVLVWLSDAGYFGPVEKGKGDGRREEDSRRAGVFSSHSLLIILPSDHTHPVLAVGGRNYPERPLQEERSSLAWWIRGGASKDGWLRI